MSNNNIEQHFIQTVSDFSNRYALFKTKRKYIVALSGGADSVALLLVMKKMGIDIDAVTCNFHLRGEESDRDEKFCVDLCNRLDVKLHRCHFDTLSYAEIKKVSIEMAARELRYGYFEHLRTDIDAEAVCVAHHQDDSVETVLMNLIRGTGINGLKGIQPLNGHIIRPLLCVGRRDIETFLKAINQDYVTDSTNLIDDVTRNKIRIRVIPLLETINPNVRKNIFNTSLNVAESIKVFDSSLNESVNDVFNSDRIDIAKLKMQPSPEYTLFYILKKYGFSPTTIKQIYSRLDGTSGRRWSSNTHDLLLDRGFLIIRKCSHCNRNKVMKISETGVYVYNEDIKLAFRYESIDKNFKIDRSSDCACLDADKIMFPLFVRVTSKGDRFCPLGMKGSKLVSDFMTDIKKTSFEKDTQLVVTDANGEIIWLMCERPDNRYKITDKTKKVLKIVIASSHRKSVAV